MALDECGILERTEGYRNVMLVVVILQDIVLSALNFLSLLAFFLEKEEREAKEREEGANKPEKKAKFS